MSANVEAATDPEPAAAPAAPAAPAAASADDAEAKMAAAMAGAGLTEETDEEKAARAQRNAMAARAVATSIQPGHVASALAAQPADVEEESDDEL